MTNTPEFKDLVGEEGSPQELERLRQVHEMLIAAGPPPELTPALEQPPAVEDAKVVSIWRRRPATVIGIAAALAAAAFLLGYAVADRRTAFDASKTLTMHGVGPTAAARGTIQIGSHDSGGNYPIQMTVTGLRKLPEGGWYELLLSKRGRPTLSCGAFAVDHTRTTVRLSVPYDLSERPRLFDGWVVTRHLPKQRPSPVVMTT